jgi:hypothetical protein
MAMDYWSCKDRSLGGFVTALVKNLQIVFYGAQRRGQRGEYSR